MKTSTNALRTRSYKSLFLALILLAITFTAGAALAHEEEIEKAEDNGSGFILGFNVGAACNSFNYEVGKRSIQEEELAGFMGGVRFGYAFNHKLALTLEGHGYGREESGDDKEEWGLGAGLLALTWHPSGGGFFVRGGLGAGGGEFLHPITKNKITVEDRGAAMFGIGYDWQLTKSFTLGLAFDSMYIDTGDIAGFDEGYLETSGATLQFNWRI